MTTPDGRISTSLQEPREEVAAVETELIRSRYVAQTFRVQIALPVRRKRENVRFPVIYVTDANLMFDALRGISYSLQLSESVAPRFILVGIGYPGTAPWAGALLRGRDLSFRGFPKTSREPPPWDGVLVAEPGTKNSDGGDDFQRFISHELTQMIDEKYPTVAGDRTYFGHSAGGSFGLFTLFNKTELFNRYILSSPAVYFHGESSAGVRYDNDDFLLREARSFIASGRPLKGIKTYMSVGTEEEFDRNLAPYHLTSSFYRLAALLKAAAIPGLDATFETFAGEAHTTAWPMAFVRGVRAVLSESRQ